MKEIKTVINSIFLRTPYNQFQQDNPYNLYSKTKGNLQYCVHPNFLKELISSLENNQLISDVFDNKYFNFENSSHMVQLRNVAQWLLSESKMTDVESALNILIKYCKENKISYQIIVAISGISINENFFLKNDMKLIDFDSLPNSHTKELQSPPYLKNEFFRHKNNDGFMLVDMTHGNYKIPKVALIKDIIRKPATDSEMMCLESHELQSLLNLPYLFSLVNSNIGVTITGSWNELSEGTPAKHEIGSSSLLPNFDSMSDKNINLNNEELNDFEGLSNCYLNLDNIAKKLFDVPLQRLNASRKRKNDIDKVIELGIALESLLLNDDIYMEKITTTFVTRGSTSINELKLGYSKTKLRLIFKKIYYLRSQSVHKGEVDAKVEIQSKIYPIAEFIQLTDDFCCHLIRSFIIKKGFPW